MNNFRELAYKNLKRKMLFRGESLFNLSDEDKDFLINSGIKVIVDLRMSQERKEEPDVSIPGCSYIHIPLITEKDMVGDPNKQPKEKVFGGYSFPDMSEMYRLFVNSKRKEAWTKIFTVLLESDSGIMFHCTSGKDRTGVASAIILSLLGIDKETIYKDYLLTNEHSVIPKPLIAFAESLDKESKEDFYKYINANRNYLDAMFDEINNQFGSLNDFYKECCSLDKSKIQLLKNKYLD